MLVLLFNLERRTSKYLTFTMCLRQNIYSLTVHVQKIRATETEEISSRVSNSKTDLQFREAEGDVLCDLTL